MISGYFKVHRKITQSKVFKKPELLQLFIWCLAQAQYSENENQPGMARGQFKTKWGIISDRFEKSISTMYSRMSALERLGCISKDGDKEGTVITICNYNTYQNGSNADLGKTERCSEDDRKMIERSSKVILIEEELEEGKEGAAIPESKIVFDPFTPQLPPDLDSPDFRQKWAELIVHRRDKRLSIRESWCVKQIKNMQKYGKEASVWAIEQTILQDWQGVFPEKFATTKKQAVSSKVNLTQAVMEGFDWAKERDANDTR